MAKPRILTIIGPTASGKTDLSYSLAEYISSKTKKNVEIISADSRQIYKHIPIATAQPPWEYLRKHKHHFINELQLNEEFNAGEFGKKARSLIAKILGKSSVPIVVGGSGLYLSSLIYGLFELEDVLDESGLNRQKEIRATLYHRLSEEGIDSMFKELVNLDPEFCTRMKNVTERRLIRALEVYYLTGIPLSTLQSRKVEIEFDFKQIGIQWEREELYKRINARVEGMIEKGLVEEIRTLKEKGFHYEKFNSLNTVGVKEVFDFLDRKINIEKMVGLIKQNTRRFAKRQMTWFKRDKHIKWVSTESGVDEMDTILNQSK